MNPLHPAYGSLATDMIRQIAEDREEEHVAIRDRLYKATLAMWSAAEEALSEGAISEDRFERFEVLALEEGLTTPRPGGRYVWGRGGLVREEG